MPRPSLIVLFGNHWVIASHMTSIRPGLSVVLPPQSFGAGDSSVRRNYINWLVCYTIPSFRRAGHRQTSSEQS